jgi:hypothetical protein
MSKPARGTATLLASFAMLGVLGGCAPLPSEPVMAGPVYERDPATGQLKTRELVWVSAGGTLRITNERMCKHDEDASNSASCVRLSTSDRRELDRFFGAQNFRKRWDAYVPCPAVIGEETELFKVTFEDGASIAKALDRQTGSPVAPACDRSTRNALTGIGDDLVKRYFR